MQRVPQDTKSKLTMGDSNMKSPQQAHVFQKLAALLLFCAMAASPLAWSATAGKVVVAKGSVQATASGQSRALQRRSLVNERDTVATGADSRTQLRFVDSALLTLDAESELVIDQYSFTGAGAAKDQVLMRLVRGGFRTVTGAIGKKNHADYKVETPLASIGIRGTIYRAEVAKDGQSVTIIAFEGRVTITSHTGQSATIGQGEKYNAARVRKDGSIHLFRVENTDTAGGGPATDSTPPNHDIPKIGGGEKTGTGDSSFHIDLQN